MGDDNYREEIERRLKECIDLTNEQKPEEAVKNYYLDDADCIEPGKRPYKAKDGMTEAFRFLITNPRKFGKVDTVEMYKKEDLVIQRVWFTYSDEQGKVHHEGNALHLWKKRNNEWCIALDMWN